MAALDLADSEWFDQGGCRSGRGCGGDGLRVLDHVCPATVKSMFTAFLGVVTTALRH